MEENILKLVKSLELEGFHLERFYKEDDNYLAYTYYGREISIAICNYHKAWYLNGRICLIKTGYNWSDFIISLLIPINRRREDFVIQKIRKYLKNPKNFNKVMEYDISILYGLK